MKPCQHPVVKTVAALCLFAAGALSGGSVVHAQPPAAGQAQLNPPAPVRPQIDPELLMILQKWELSGKQTNKLEGKHSRYIYDSVFNVCKWSEGEFYYEAPDKGRIDLQAPKKFKAGQMVPKDGKQYQVQADKAERWICDGTQVIAIDEERDEFQRIAIPVKDRGANITNGPLPFLFGISVQKILTRYQIALHNDPAQGGRHDMSKGVIHLRVRPLWKQDAANWKMAEVMLNNKYLPTAIKLTHPSGNAETVYVFYDVEKNEGRGVFSLWKGDPFAPSLKGYKELRPTVEAKRDVQRQ